MVPARQRLEADDLAVAARHRLVVQGDLVARDRRLQVVLQRALLAQPLVHVGLEEPDGAATVGLGPIERRIGIAEQRRGIGAVGREHRDPDAQPHAQMMAVDVEAVRHGGEQALGEHCCGAGCGSAVTTTTNSSPPGRARKAPPVTALRRSVTWHSRASPTPWPNTSLTSLKRSRSMHTTAKRCSAAVALASVAAKKLLKLARLGRSVSGS